MSASGSQRYYRAPCPGCGAPVEFRSAQSTHAVCPYCQSTVVRAGETLARTGKMAELFDDFSPLQLFAAGRIDNQPFTLVGRLQPNINRVKVHLELVADVADEVFGNLNP